MAVAAVRRGGRPIVMRGSRMAASGSRYWDRNGSLWPVSSSRTTETLVTSEPVPLVVGTANSGRSRRLSTWAPE
jgi:hypothetical protein